jgi:hypothetical protein
LIIELQIAGGIAKLLKLDEPDITIKRDTDRGYIGCCPMSQRLG